MTAPAAERSGNAFDLVRLTSAGLVIVSHSAKLTGHADPLDALTGGRVSLGTLGVIAFFFTSGLLISASWHADPHVGRFAARRALRIAPLYTVTVLACALIVGPLASTLPAASVLTHARTWTYVVNNLLVFPLQWDLPGVFAANPVPSAVNGSLWTIPIEILCYAGVVVLAAVGLSGSRPALTAIALALVLGCGVVDLTAYTGPILPRLVPAAALPLVAAFVVGMAARRIRDRPRWWVGPACALAVPGLAVSPVPSLCLVPWCALTWWVAFTVRGRAARPTRSYDLSFGLYVLAFPVQQWLVASGLTSPSAVALATAALVVPLAAACWVVVERPALSLKPRAPREPSAGTDVGVAAGTTAR